MSVLLYVVLFWFVLVLVVVLGFVLCWVCVSEWFNLVFVVVVFVFVVLLLF